MIVLGVTGSIAMGKSTITKLLRTVHQVPVWDADLFVKQLYASDTRFLQELYALFPRCFEDGGVDKQALGEHVFGDEEALGKLEQLIHPRALSAMKMFIMKCQGMGMRVCAVDVPLLFETGQDRLCDETLVVVARPHVQINRMQRRGKSPAMVKQIKQMIALPTKGH